MKRFAATVYLTILGIGVCVFVAEARPAYARKENKDCGYCHVRSGGGGERGFRGQFFGANGLSFGSFDEKRESTIAGLSAGAEGRNSVPAISYSGNVAGPASQQIQLASLRGPVILLFLGKSDENSKAAVKSFAALAKAYGTQATLLGVAMTDDPVRLTEELGGVLRVYPDPESMAIKKFSAKQALDIAVVAKLGDPLKTFEGFSRSNIDAVTKLMAVSQNTPIPAFELSQVPDKSLRGPKLLVGD